jgi:hypothetical protein
MPWKKREIDMVIVIHVDTVAVPNIQRELTLSFGISFPDREAV